MVQQNKWVFFEDIEWNDPNFNRFHIDTRDFHCGYAFVKEEHEDIKTLAKYPHFFFSEDELKETIADLFSRSGGKGKWRSIYLDSTDQRVGNWNLKYLRIYRCEDSRFIVCNNKHQALTKALLSLDIQEKYLS